MSGYETHFADQINRCIQIISKSFPNFTSVANLPYCLMSSKEGYKQSCASFNNVRDKNLLSQGSSNVQSAIQ